MNAMQNDVISVIFNHRSIRKYKRYKIPEEHITFIEKAAQRAPTDATLHLWTAIRVDDQNKREQIAERIGQTHVKEASLFYIYLADLYRIYKILSQHKIKHIDDDFALFVFSAIDAALAAENMALAAESLGYGICFIGAIQNAAEYIIDLLELPVKTYPLFGLTIGVPDENPSIRPRLPLNMLIHVDKYREYSQDDIISAVNIMNRITRSHNWIKLVSKYVSKNGYFGIRSVEMKYLLKKQGFTGI